MTEESQWSEKAPDIRATLREIAKDMERGTGPYIRPMTTEDKEAVVEDWAKARLRVRQRLAEDLYKREFEVGLAAIATSVEISPESKEPPPAKRTDFEAIHDTFLRAGFTVETHGVGKGLGASLIVHFPFAKLQLDFSGDGRMFGTARSSSTSPASPS